MSRMPAVDFYMHTYMGEYMGVLHVCMCMHSYIAHTRKVAQEKRYAGAFFFSNPAPRRLREQK